MMNVRIIYDGTAIEAATSSAEITIGDWTILISAQGQADLYVRSQEPNCSNVWIHKKNLIPYPRLTAEQLARPV